VNGHSGLGKTQLPFAFKAADVKVCHLTMTGTTSQKIYVSFSSLSKLFTTALRDDLNKGYFVESDSLNSELLVQNSTLQLRTVGFIFSIMGVPYADSLPWTVTKLRDCISNLESKQNLPIFFLDEVLPHHDDSRDHTIQDLVVNVRFARNLLRAVGLVPVLMGTNSYAANLMTAATASRTSSSVWCELITELPLPNEESLRILGALDLMTRLGGIPSLVSLCSFLSQQFRICTPWFTELFVRVAAEGISDDQWHSNVIDFLDHVLAGMAHLVYDTKSRIRSKNGLQAQFCLHLNDCKFHAASFEEEKQDSTSLQDARNPCIPKETSSFVANHFASLTDSVDCSLVTSGVGLRKRDDREIWKAPAAFKRASGDCFLYLLLCDGNLATNFPTPFALSAPGDERARMTTLEAFNEVKQDTKQVVGSNRHAKKRDGNVLEVGSAVAIEIASHRGGLGGILFLDFILQLATELCLSFKHLNWMNPPVRIPCDHLAPSQTGKKRKSTSESESQPQPQPESRDIPEDIKLKKVPYLSCENDTWPEEFKNIEGVEWGELKRVRDSERVDMKIFSRGSGLDSPRIAVECKNYSHNLDLNVLKGILERVHAANTCWLHLVICTRVQDSYFTSSPNAWSSFNKQQKQKRQIDFQNIAIFKVVLSDPQQLSLEPLFRNSVPTSYARVVIFFPFESWP
jgi:hypothetical protein